MKSHELFAALREARLAAGLTLRQAAAQSGLSLPYICNIEHGRATPTLGNLARLANIYGLECRVEIGPQSTRLGDIALTSDEDTALRRLLAKEATNGSE